MIRDRDEAARNEREAAERTALHTRQPPAQQGFDPAAAARATDSSASRSPAVRLIDRYLHAAADKGASDLHLEYRSATVSEIEFCDTDRRASTTREFSAAVKVRARVDGRLRALDGPPPNLAASLLTRLRLMARVDLSERRLPQDGRFSFEHGGKTLDIRAAFVPVHGGEKVVMRLLRRGERTRSLEELGLEAEQLACMDPALMSAGGLVVIAGPTGAGKTTSAYAVVERMRDPTLSVVSAEDPVEQTLEGVAQIAIDDECGRTFARVLRGILRLDPDIILIGEIRDEQSAEIACRAALTGHRVVTTLHASDTREAHTRLLDIGVPEPMLAATVKLVVAQRLLRRLCTRCRATKPVPEFARRAFRTVGLSAPVRVATAAGCRHCENTGYASRFPVFEIFVRDSGERGRPNPRPGGDSLFAAALARVAKLDTTIEEALSQCPAPQPAGTEPEAP
jgi:type II secretory ATPase GspE/PulE/Tfp pilus assembly ATPase PilB-like protein